MKIDRGELFSRLAEGHAAGVTVVTPNKRLAQELQKDFDSYQTQRGLTVWEAPDILPFGAFVERLWEDALYSPAGGAMLPLLLTGAQEQVIWEHILGASGLLAVPQAAAQCREAWRLVHQWRIRPGQGGEDADAFARWGALYRRQTAGEVDAARLPDLMLDHLKDVQAPRLLVAYGFDVLPPQTKEFLERFEARSCFRERISGDCSRAAFASAAQELEAAAQWARARLEEGKSRIGVVVPELGRRRKEVARVFARVMRPGHGLPGAAAAPLPFNVSLGEPLSACPLVNAALCIIELAGRAVPFSRASRLLRSPFLGGAESEIARRAALDARLRREAGATITLARLVALAEPAPKLRSLLERVFVVGKEEAVSPCDWARHFSALLDAAGFPGERVPDSAEFQAAAKWHEALGELSRLERVSPRMAFDEAFGFLERHCADTLFQPESPDAPVQVLGAIESAGLRFDCLWVSGLTDEAWPVAAAPSPFIPVRLQREAGVPQASAEASLELDRRRTEEWKGAAAEVIFSFPLKDKDRDLSPSPLIRDVAERPVAPARQPRYRDLLFAAKKLEPFADAKAPPVAQPKVRGGTRVLSDQSACPFRAFARWRLGAEALEDPTPGPDARDRGKLLHVLMAQLWASLRNSESLKGDPGPAIAVAAEAAVKELGLEGRFAELERSRLAKLAREWLEVEARRPPFEILLLEEKRTLSVAGLELQSRIDRMDRLKAGGHALIDYKTGNVANPRQWLGPRPDDPQLPLYATAAPEELAAVALAKLKTGEMRFMGFSRAPDLIPKVNVAESWPGLLAQWKKDAEALGKSFAAGEARVDPKDGLKTCRLCELQTLCRVYEKLNSLEGGDADR